MTGTSKDGRATPAITGDVERQIDEIFDTRSPGGFSIGWEKKALSAFKFILKHSKEIPVPIFNSYMHAVADIIAWKDEKSLPDDPIDQRLLSDLATMEWN